MTKRSEEAAMKEYHPIYPKGKRLAKRVQSESVDTHQPIRTIFQKGYELAEKDLGWHSVEESLPEIDEEVIVLADALDLGMVYRIAFGHIVNKEYCQDYNGWNIPGVKFWMPMPKIPDEKESK